MEQVKKITGAEFVRIVTDGQFFKVGYLSKNNPVWDNVKEHYTSENLNIEQTFEQVVLLLGMVEKIRGIDSHDWVTAKARSKDIVHSDDVYEDLKDSAFYLMEHNGRKLLVHDYLGGCNLSIKLMKN